MSRTSRSLTFQALESRLPFAADVAVTFSSNNLTITGDGDAENVTLREFELAGIEFLEISGVNGTTVNGKPSVTFRSTNLNDIQANLGGGDDRLTIFDLDSTVADTIYDIRLGAGNDRMDFVSSDTAGDVSIFGEAGDDVVNVRFSDIGEKLRVDLGFGDDSSQIRSVKAEDITLTGGNDEDQVLLLSVDVIDQLLMNLGDGDDTLDFVDVDAGRYTLNGGIGDDDEFTILQTGDQDDSFAFVAADDFESVQFRS